MTLYGEAEFQLNQLMDILESKLVKRGIDISCMEVSEPDINVAEARQTATLRQGLESLQAKKLVKIVKEAKLKVQVAIQGEKVRITGKKRDDLQSAMAVLREANFEMPLQYNNFRD